MSEIPADLPNLDSTLFQRPDPAALFAPAATHPPRFLLLYGSLRERSYSRLAAEEAARLIQTLGGETRLYNPSGLPLVDDAGEDHPVRELHALVQWAEGMVWSSPERHGAMTGLMKTQIDWIPLSVAPCARRRARRWPSCRCREARSPSTPSTRCGCWGAGCAC